MLRLWKSNQNLNQVTWSKFDLFNHRARLRRSTLRASFSIGQKWTDPTVENTFPFIRTILFVTGFEGSELSVCLLRNHCDGKYFVEQFLLHYGSRQSKSCVCVWMKMCVGWDGWMLQMWAFSERSLFFRAKWSDQVYELQSDQIKTGLLVL